MSLIISLSNRSVSKIVLFCLALSLLGSEWIYGKADQLPSFFRDLARIIPSILLIMLILKKHAFFLIRGNNTRLSWYTLGVIAVFIMLSVRVFIIPTNTSSFRLILQIIQAIFFGYMGYWLARDEKELFWILKKIATAGAIIGLLDVFGTLTGLRNSSLLFPAWPMRLIVLFSYCWYMYSWLANEKRKSKINLVLIGSIAGIWVTFQKPIVFAAFFSTFFLFWFVNYSIPKRNKIYNRLLFLLSISFLTLLVINIFTSNAVLESVSETYYNKFLRVTEGTSIKQLQYNDLYGASGGRLNIWPIAIDNIKENPWFGKGERQIFDGGAETGTITAHNWFLDMLLWVGILGSFPFFVGLLWWFRFATKKRVLHNAGDVVVPVLSFSIGLTAYNLGGTMLSFYSIISFLTFLIAIATKYVHNNSVK